MENTKKEKMEAFYKYYCERSKYYQNELAKNEKTQEFFARMAAHLSYRASVMRALTFGDQKAKAPNIREKGEKIISEFLVKSLENPPATVGEVAKYWEKLHNLYLKEKIEDYTYGNAQKWVNMAIKYFIILLSHNGLEYEQIAKIPVFPVDGIMIQVIKKDKKIEINGKIPEPWSKCDDKKAFIHFIKTVDSQKDKKYNTLFEFELDSWSPN